MASVSNSKEKFYDFTIQSGEAGEAQHAIESEADIFIKKLSRKQLDTNISLEQQLNYHKEFQTHHIYQPVNESTVGVITLQNFTNNYLREETNQKNQIDDANLPGNKKLSRHVKELALATKPNSLETKLLKFAIECNAVGQVEPDIRPFDHPINQLNVIEHDLFGHLSDNSNPKLTAKTILRKRKQLLESISDPIEIKQKPVVFNGKSLWDINEKSENFNKSKKPKLYICQKQKLFTIRDQKIVEIEKNDDTSMIEGNHVEVNPNYDTKESQFHGRLSEDEIRSLPKFSNYTKGIPNETLYLKNLAFSVQEDDLSSLFSKYQKPEKPCITYKLMKQGKMRGQAFINCHCLETATEAMEELNGVFLHGKPVIIQFSSSGKNSKID